MARIELGEIGNFDFLLDTASGNLDVEDGSGNILGTFEATGDFALPNGTLDIQDGTRFDDTNDSMTANPETDTESGYIEVEVNGTTKQIPFYDP